MVEPDPNPYASPKNVGERLRAVVPVIAEQSRSGIGATLAKKSLLYRRIVVETPVRATIIYMGRTLRDKILVNNQLVAWRLPIFGLSHTFEFEIRTETQTLPARIIVDVNMWLQMKLFQLEIDGETIYTESL